MKASLSGLILRAVLLAAVSATAATRYVNLNNLTPSAPYTSWSDAATNIQDAVDTASAGDSILVTNGVYQIGIGNRWGVDSINRGIPTGANNSIIYFNSGQDSWSVLPTNCCTTG